MSVCFVNNQINMELTIATKIFLFRSNKNNSIHWQLFIAVKYFD